MEFLLIKKKWKYCYSNGNSLSNAWAWISINVNCKLQPILLRLHCKHEHWTQTHSFYLYKPKVHPFLFVHFLFIRLNMNTINAPFLSTMNLTLIKMHSSHILYTTPSFCTFRIPSQRFFDYEKKKKEFNEMKEKTKKIYWDLNWKQKQ